MTLINLKRLKKLYLGAAIPSFRIALTDKDLYSLISLNNLQELYLNGREKITDRGMEYLKDLINLESLDIYYSQITDQEMKFLKDMNKIKELNISNTKISDEGLKYNHRDSIIKLELSLTKITDNSLKYLKEMENLTELNLSSTKISDKSINDLANLKKLKKLKVYSTNLSDSEKQQLKKLLPHCKVSY